MGGSVNGVFEEGLEADVMLLGSRQQHGAARLGDALEELHQFVDFLHDVRNQIQRIARVLQVFAHVANRILKRVVGDGS